MKKHRPVRNMALAVMLGLLSMTAYAQAPNLPYSGFLIYSIPHLSSVPPLDTTQPTDVSSAYLWSDELMRTTSMSAIDNWIDNLGYGDTMKFLAKMLYRVSDNNPLALYQWELSSNPVSATQQLRWHYKGVPATNVSELTNRIGGAVNDTGRTGYILACDFIDDVIVNDTVIKSDASPTRMVFANAVIIDPIKGKKVPLCVGGNMLAHRKGSQAQNSLMPWSTYAVRADTGSCMQFDYSPDWQRGAYTDAPDPTTPVLSDSIGWWIKPGGEYIMFLRMAGIGADTSNGYFSVQPYWGVFGSEGGVYRVISGIVQDPNDDFGIGASTGLTVADWKSRFRTRIYNILNP